MEAYDAAILSLVDPAAGKRVKMSFATLPISIHQEMVDEALTSDLRWLCFRGQLEQLFEQETGEERSWCLVIGGLIGLLIFDFYLLVDWWAGRGSFRIALEVRLGLVTPLELAAIIVLSNNPIPMLREAIIVVMGAWIPAAAHLYLVNECNSWNPELQYMAIALVIIFVTSVQRIRFWFALPACFGTLLLFSVAVSQVAQFSADVKLTASVMMLSVVVLGLFSNYVGERITRLSYLLALRSRFQKQAIERLCRFDSLTGLCNRRALDDALKGYISPPGAPGIVAAILIDIDHFKAFNDTAGHQAGDLCLKRVANVLEKNILGRPAEAFRYGGEEFVVLLPGADLGTAIRAAEALCQSFHATVIPHPAFDRCVTCSFGVASGPLTCEMDVVELIRGADTALYAAKHAGRDQVWPKLPPLVPTLKVAAG